MRFLGFLGLMACAGTPPETAVVPQVQVNPDDPATCAGCHGAIVEAWQGSQHARAHEAGDPVFAGMVALRVAREGEGLRETCATCHSPRVAEGADAVGCGSCHAPIRAVSGGTVAPHSLGAVDARLRDGTQVCLTCHATQKNAAGVVTCNTGQEHEGSGTGSCTSCHMPEVAGPSGAGSARTAHRSHAFVGPHGRWTGGPVLDPLRLDARWEGDQLRVDVVNLSGHTLPTGFPGRVLVVSARTTVVEDLPGWSNFVSDPMTEDPAAVFGRRYTDAEGNPVLAPYAEKMAADTTLKPGETRTLTWTPPPEVPQVEITAVYRLVGQAAVGPLGLEGKPESEPRPVAKVMVNR